MIQMPNNSDFNVITADALTLLLHNQHAIAAALEEITHWLSGPGADTVADNAVSALGTLDTNAEAITDSIMRLRQC
jgi:predicted naringenin-chalcone synthase